MRRLFWVAVGATAGVYAARRIGRATRALDPDHAGARVAGALGDLATAVRDFSADVRSAMAEREDELRQELGLVEVVDAPPLPEVPAHVSPLPRGAR
ncbi:MAG TPA: DUF6167 family protein [Jiangellales bacterium]|nr:DUF6167 family protein [Jiangellales bacterium]